MSDSTTSSPILARQTLPVAVQDLAGVHQVHLLLRRHRLAAGVRVRVVREARTKRALGHEWSELLALVVHAVRTSVVTLVVLLAPLHGRLILLRALRLRSAVRNRAMLVQDAVGEFGGRERAQTTEAASQDALQHPAA